MGGGFLFFSSSTLSFLSSTHTSMNKNDTPMQGPKPKHQRRNREERKKSSSSLQDPPLALYSLVSPGGVALTVFLFLAPSYGLSLAQRPILTHPAPYRSIQRDGPQRVCRALAQFTGAVVAAGAEEEIASCKVLRSRRTVAQCRCNHSNNDQQLKCNCHLAHHDGERQAKKKRGRGEESKRRERRQVPKQ